MARKGINLWRQVKTRNLFVLKLECMGIPENRIKNTIAILHQIVSLKEYNKKRNKVFLNDDGNEVFRFSSRVFKKYLQDDYPFIIQTLIDNDYLYVHQHFSIDGHLAKGYGPTHKLLYEIENFQEEYLNDLIKSKYGIALHKANKEKNSQILKTHDFDDPLVKNEYMGETEIDFYTNWPKIERMLNLLHKNKAVSNRGHIINLIEGEIDKKRKRNEKTGRIYTTFNSISNIIRRQVKIAGKDFALDIDMRACHLSFLADYLHNKKPSEKMKEERDLWRSIFEKDQDPREWLGVQAGIKGSDSISQKRKKRFMNSWINSGKYPVFDNYMKKHWPILYKVWKGLNCKVVGNDISLYFESVIFRSDWLIELQNKHDVVALSTHDGFCVFGDKTAANIFFEEFQAKAREIAGWKVYFTKDEGTDLNIKKELQSFDIKALDFHDKNLPERADEIESQKEEYLNRLDKNGVKPDYS